MKDLFKSFSTFFYFQDETGFHFSKVKIVSFLGVIFLSTLVYKFLTNSYVDESNFITQDLELSEGEIDSLTTKIETKKPTMKSSKRNLSSRSRLKPKIFIPDPGVFSASQVMGNESYVSFKGRYLATLTEKLDSRVSPELVKFRILKVSKKAARGDSLPVGSTILAKFDFETEKLRFKPDRAIKEDEEFKINGSLSNFQTGGPYLKGKYFNPILNNNASSVALNMVKGATNFLSASALAKVSATRNLKSAVAGAGVAGAFEVGDKITDEALSKRKIKEDYVILEAGTLAVLEVY